MKTQILVILGASGDLVKRKIIPSLYQIFIHEKLSSKLFIIGVGRSDLDDIKFREKFSNFNEGGFLNNLYYVRVPDYTKLNHVKDRIEQIKNSDKLEVLFYLALPPSVYPQIPSALASTKIISKYKNLRIIVEKPYGYDLKSAKDLNRIYLQYFKESQIYRIDHYLGKEPVQNIMAFRFANHIFEPLWNNKFIDHIQISCYEDIGVENRIAYFDASGIIRDMVQNHLIQLMSLLMMEPPSSLECEDIRIEKIKLLRCVRKVKDVIKGQYRRYRDISGVKDNSCTETFAALKLYVDNWRWAQTPVYIRVGKYMSRRATEIGVIFKEVPYVLFNKERKLPPNKIIFKIQPAEGIILEVISKMPGGKYELIPTSMNFCFRDHFSQYIPDAYTNLLLDFLKGDQTLFVSSMETETAWELLEDIIKIEKIDFYYERGENNPSLCRDFIERDKREWLAFERYEHVCK